MVWKRENIQWAAVVWMKMSCWCKRSEENGLVRDDRKATVTQITNQGLQNTISEHTTRRTLKQMCSSSRRPHRVPLRSDKNSTRRHTGSPKLDHRGLETRGFLRRHSDGRLRIWCEVHERRCLNGSGCWWGCNAVGGILEPIEHRLNTSLPEYCCWPSSLYDYSVLIFWCTSSRIIHQSSNHLKHDDEFTLLTRPPPSPDLSPIEQLWDVLEREILIMD